jgi:pilus assembly protein FimV
MLIQKNKQMDLNKGARLSRLALLGFCLTSAQLQALGVGEIQLESYFNEPLKAHVRLLDSADLTADEIKVQLPNQSAFEEAGVDRVAFLSALKINLKQDSEGGWVIDLSSDTPISEPYLNFLLEINWPTGRILKEYTVLLDPPREVIALDVLDVAPKISSVDSAPKADLAEAALANPSLPVSKNVDTLPPSKTVEQVEPPQRLNLDKKNTDTAVSNTGASVKVGAGDSLWKIAKKFQPEDSHIMQTMMAIQKLNPNAFNNKNMNELKRGVQLKMPSADEVKRIELKEALVHFEQAKASWENKRLIGDSKKKKNQQV